MFKNAEVDKLAVPARGQYRRTSTGPTRRHFTAAPGGGVDTSAVSSAAAPMAGGVSSAVPSPAATGITDPGAAATSTMGSPASPTGEARTEGSSLNPTVAKVLDREARSFMDREGTTDDRQELLYRARRHASTLTSTWSPEASHRVTEAFCGRVAAMIPNRPRVAAAQPVTFTDFDDALLY